MKVVITDYQYESVETERRIITAAGFTLEDYQAKTEQELIAATHDADAVIVQYGAITRTVIKKMERCKAIIKYGIGVNNIDTKAAEERGIAVCNVPDYGVDEVSNHAIAMLFALCKKLPVLAKYFTAGEWGYSATVPLYRLEGSTLGLVGLGRIPQLVAKKMAGFGVRLLAYDPYAKPETARALGVTLTAFDTLCRESDAISVHCPLTEETHHLFDAAAFAKMKRRAIFINTARGPVVDEQALIAALCAGTIAGAGVDVFEQEPPASDNPLLTLENVIATPHAAWYSEEAIAALQRKAAEEAVNVLHGNAPWNAVR